MKQQPQPQQVSDYVDALIQSAAQIGQIIDQMERFARRSGQRRTRSPVSVLGELVEGIVTDREVALDLAAIEETTALIAGTTEAIGHNLFFVDPDGLEEAA